MLIKHESTNKYDNENQVAYYSGHTVQVLYVLRPFEHLGRRFESHTKQGTFWPLCWFAVLPSKDHHQLSKRSAAL